MVGQERVVQSGENIYCLVVPDGPGGLRNEMWSLESECREQWRLFKTAWLVRTWMRGWVGSPRLSGHVV